MSEHYPLQRTTAVVHSGRSTGLASLAPLMGSSLCHICRKTVATIVHHDESAMCEEGQAMDRLRMWMTMYAAGWRRTNGIPVEMVDSHAGDTLQPGLPVGRGPGVRSLASCAAAQAEVSGGAGC